MVCGILSKRNSFCRAAGGSFRNCLVLDQRYRYIRRLALTREPMQGIAAGHVLLRMKPPWHNPPRPG